MKTQWKSVSNFFARLFGLNSAKKSVKRTVKKTAKAKTALKPKRRRVAAVAVSALAFLFTFNMVNAESLWLKAGPNANTYYSDRRASRPGDILTVFIKEITDISANKKTKAEKKATIADTITSWFFGAKGGNTERTANANASDTYEGKGDIQDKQSVNTSIVVTVTDVLPNGNLIIEGVRALTYSNEKQYMVLQGLVRADDIAANNTILSTQIANASIEIKEEGDLSSAQRKGWLMKLNDFIGPF